MKTIKDISYKLFIFGLLWIVIAITSIFIAKPSNICIILLFYIPFCLYLYLSWRINKIGCDNKKIEDNEKCKHINKKKVIYRDKKYDRENDNDDIDDFPTFIEVVYCKDCGKIISIDIMATIEIDLDRVPFQYTPNESSYAELDEFKKIAGITELPSLLDKEKYID